MEQHTRLLKSDTYSRVGLLELRYQPCFLKLYLAKSRWQRLGVRLGYGRALRSFDMAGELVSRGLPVPAPRACVQVAEGMLLLTEGILESRDLRALWLEQPQPGLAELLMRSAGETLALLHRAGFAHGDCKWSNLLWSGGQFYLVDLDSVRQLKFTAAAARSPLPRQLRDLARFTVDAEELGASQQQYDRFLDSYCVAAQQERELLAAGIRSSAAPIRARHAKIYANAHKHLC
jgi:tRNA A-37 threonylcarbamoyl transferase component Bud32